MKKIIALVISFSPSLALAQNAVIHDVNSLTGTLTSIGNVVIQLLIAFAVIYIIIRVVQFIMESDSTKRSEIRASILYGILGLFVILSIWGLVAILTGSFRTVNNPPTNQFPQIPPTSEVNTQGR